MALIAHDFKPQRTTSKRCNQKEGQCGLQPSSGVVLANAVPIRFRTTAGLDRLAQGQEGHPCTARYQTQQHRVADCKGNADMKRADNRDRHRDQVLPSDETAQERYRSRKKLYPHDRWGQQPQSRRLEKRVHVPGCNRVPGVRIECRQRIGMVGPSSQWVHVLAASRIEVNPEHLKLQPNGCNGNDHGIMPAVRFAQAPAVVQR